DSETVPVRAAAGLLEVAAAVKKTKRMALYLGDTLYVAADAGKQYAMVLEATLLDAGLDAAGVYLALRDALEDAACQKLLFDAKAMEHTLARHGIALAGVEFDAMLADYLLHALHPTDSLSSLCGELLHAQPGAAVLFALRDTMEKEMQTQGLTALYRDMELPLSHVLFTMEQAGFAVDAKQLQGLSEQFGTRVSAIEKEIFELAGEPFNILSPKQLGTVLFETLKLPVQKKTKSGYSTDAEVMEKLQDMHPIVPLVMEYRFLCKLKSTFVDALMAKAAQGDKRIHTSFNQNVTATGRISSTEPNLQNIPVRTELGREIRRAFVASPGCMLVDADYSQIELRLLAHMSGDKGMIDAFNAGDDIHTRTASEVFGVPLKDVTKQQRSAAKAVNFGIVYGISDFGLARNLGISRKTAGEYIQMYLARYPGVQAYMKKSVEEGKAQGFVRTLMGRRRELPEIRSGNFNTRAFGERVALNMPIQGTAADIIKLAMVRVYDALREAGLQARLILQVHDELIVDTPEQEVETVKAILKDRMQHIIELDVPLIADVETGYSWYDAK
ncbi:MAG: DNA polymerase I, partial [Clostridia bacterium]|nr:DNA polymerase I [Clostridia bacterium]